MRTHLEEIAPQAVQATPRPWQVTCTYLVLGVEHILRGIDHLLFVLGLLILVRGWRKIVGTITAFTVAHSITLAAATLGFVHVPGKPVEAIIALSIVFVACEIVRRSRGQSGLTERRPWIVAFTFGLLHGFGFAGALSEVGLPQNAVPLALLFFNVGVELGQLIFIGAVTTAIAVLIPVVSRFEQHDSRPKIRFAFYETLAAYAIGSVAAYWLVERTLSFFV